MSNENNCVAYNRKRVKGRNILALTEEERITKFQIFCTAEVFITNAEYVAEPAKLNSLPRPYLRVEGIVNKVKLEDPNLVFPCGTKTMSFMPGEDERVTLLYRLSDAEISSLAAKGLFCNFENEGRGYPPPPNMINNVMDIPLNIVYYGIENEPIALMEIIKPDEIPTETRLNTYYGLFELSPYEEKVVHELEGKIFPNGLGEPVVTLPEADFILKQRALENNLGHQQTADLTQNQVREEVVEEEAPEQDNVNPEDAAIIDKISNTIQSAANRDEIIHTDKSGFDPRNVVEAVNAEYAAQEAQREADIEREYGINYNNASTPANTKAKPATIADKMELLRKMTARQDSDGNADTELNNENMADPYAMLNQNEMDTDDKDKVGSIENANAQTVDANEQLRKIDRALDNQALNAGITDIAGHGASDNNNNNSDGSDQKSESSFDDVSSLLGGIMSEFDLGENVTESDIREAQADKQRQVARRVDVALDNQALNAGITDIAGHGVHSEVSKSDKNDESEKDRAAADLVAGIKTNNQPSDQKFL